MVDGNSAQKTLALRHTNSAAPQFSTILVACICNFICLSLRIQSSPVNCWWSAMADFALQAHWQRWRHAKLTGSRFFVRPPNDCYPHWSHRSVVTILVEKPAVFRDTKIYGQLDQYTKILVSCQRPYSIAHGWVYSHDCSFISPKPYAIYATSPILLSDIFIPYFTIVVACCWFLSPSINHHDSSVIIIYTSSITISHHKPSSIIIYNSFMTKNHIKTP